MNSWLETLFKLPGMPFYLFIFFFHVDNSPQRKNETKQSSTKIILISVSAAVVSLTVIGVAVYYWRRYEDIFALYWFSRVAFLLLTDESLLRDRLGKSKKGSLDKKERSCSLCEWALTSDLVLK